MVHEPLAIQHPARPGVNDPKRSAVRNKLDRRLEDRRVFGNQNFRIGIVRQRVTDHGVWKSRASDAATGRR